jgi:hypothetical protein
VQGTKPLPKLKKKTVYFLKVQPVKVDSDNIHKEVGAAAGSWRRAVQSDVGGMSRGIRAVQTANCRR